MPRDGLVFLHTSDEMYGADRVVLDLFDALPGPDRARAELWLPTDLPHGANPLCVALERRGGRVRHVDLPVLRRAYRRPRALLALARRTAHLTLELRRARPAMVYCTTSAAFLAAPAARSAGVPRVVGHVQEIWSPGDTRILGRLARACDTMVAISGPVRDTLPEPLRARTTVVANATPEPDRVVDLDGRDGPLTFLVASRWNAWKGHRTLLAAWDRLGAGRASAELVVLGGPPPSGDAVDVHALRSELGDPASVRVVGEVADPHPYVDDADVVLVPSDQPEPFGLVAVEAFARGRPVVGSAAGGLADIVTDGEDGWLFPPGDADALARVLAGLDRDLVTAAGRAARATYERRYTADRYAAQWREAVGLA